ncbi:MAG TPA: histidine--tRNA ligase [Bacteroidia bacterium]
MAKQKPSIPSGTRDFSPIEMVRRNFIFETVKKVFQRYGYLPIETPAMENIETLTGKYGEEGDQLLFKILNSRQHEAKNKDEIRKEFERSLNQNVISSLLTERALRYDLTVPFARYVVQHQNEITFPFKRYQVQPVWRGDRPQKGRYREFYQCDADVIGSDSLLCEAELVQIIDDVFTQLNVPVTIKINNRKILSGIAEVIGEKDKIVDITVAIDKLDKIGLEKVNEELLGKGVTSSAIQKLQPIFELKGRTDEKLLKLSHFLEGSAIGMKGIEEVKQLFHFIAADHLQTAIYELDITLARGLNYYTGAIFEVKSNLGTLSSSICGGGRYDDLTGIFGLPGMSGVGISFGIDRIFDVMNELDLFEKVIDQAKETTKLLFAHFGEKEREYCIALAARAREAGINTEIYPDVKKIGKQFDYANKKQIPFVVVIGNDEMQSGELTLKDMSKGEQVKMKIEEIIEKLKV